MNVNASGSMQHMQMQHQMQGARKGQGGMKDIMQNLSPEDRNALKEKMSSLSQVDKQSMISQMKEIDASSMSSDEYAQSLFDIFDQANTTNTTDGFSIYA